MKKNYKLGNTKKEREVTFVNIVEMFENGTSLKEIAELYGVTKQAISFFLQRRGYYPRNEYQRVRKEKIKELLDKGILKEIKKIRKEKHDIESKLCTARENAHFYVTRLQGAKKTMKKILNLIEKLIEEHENSGYCTLYSKAQDSIEGPEPENSYDNFYDVGRYDCLTRLRDDVRTLIEEN